MLGRVLKAHGGRRDRAPGGQREIIRHVASDRKSLLAYGSGRA